MKQLKVEDLKLGAKVKMCSLNWHYTDGGKIDPALTTAIVTEIGGNVAIITYENDRTSSIFLSKMRDTYFKDCFLLDEEVEIKYTSTVYKSRLELIDE